MLLVTVPFTLLLLVVIRAVAGAAYPALPRVGEVHKLLELDGARTVRVHGRENRSHVLLWHIRWAQM